LNDLTTIKGTSGRIAGPDGIDPLVREAAADGPAAHLCRAAFNAILNGEQPAGYHSVAWDGRNNRGEAIGSGLYFYRIEAKPNDGGTTFVEVKKMMIIK